MGLRIQTRSATVPANPFLDARPAFQHWLAPALQRLDTPAVDHVVATDSGETGSLVTWLGREPRPAHAVLVSAAQLRLGNLPVQAVIPVPLETIDLPANDGSGDGLAFAYDPDDDPALIDAVSIAARSERPLVVLVDENQELTPVAETAIKRGVDAGWLTVERVLGHQVPAALAEAAAYLATRTRVFDMAAITALGCGTPVIAVEGSLVTDSFVHGESGYVARDADHAVQWVEMLGSLYPRQARVRSRMLFDPEMVALRYAELYRAVDKGRRLRFLHPERPQPGRESLLAAS